MRCAAPLLAIAALLTACAPSMTSVPAPVPGVRVQSWAVEVRDTAAKDIYIRNDGTEDLVITSMQLYGCQNLRQECKVYTPNVMIPAGKTVKAMRLEADNTKLSWKYQYTFSTRLLTPARTPTVSPMGSFTTISRIGGRLPFVGIDDPEQFIARVPAQQGTWQCSRSPLSPSGFETLMMVKLSEEGAPLSLIYVDLDAEGRPSLYTEQRGAMRYVPGMPGADSLPPRTIISVQVQQGLANLLNEGDRKPAEYYAVTGSAVMQSSALGNPAEMMARVIRECGGK
jgi:hypothetical protein